MAYQERIPQRVYRLTFVAKSQEQCDLIYALLKTVGVKEDELISSEVKGALHVLLYREQAKDIKPIYQMFKKLALAHIALTLSALKPDDWASKWKRGWKPARLTKRLDVVPLWHKDKYRRKPGRDFILMDTLMSFGTGLHETTRIVAQFIEDNKAHIKSFLDIGTGTGVLTLVALKHGAKDVLAIDIGELSVEAAQKNGRLNKMPFNVLCQDIGTFKHRQQYDFVAANLVTHDLVSWRKQILRFVKPNGLLAVSGISLDNWSRFEQGFIAPPLVLLKARKGKKWAGALFQVT